MLTHKSKTAQLENADALSFGERIHFLIETQGLSKRWVSDRLGITKQAFNYLLKHASKPKYIDGLAELLHANPAWITSGQGTAFHDPEPKSKRHRLKIHDDHSLLSIIQQNQACAEWSEGDKHDFIDYPEGEPHTFFAYKIQNDSLFPPFIENTIFIFEKNKSPIHSDYVLTLIQQNDAHHLEIKAYTHHEHEKTENSIVGVLVEARYII